MWSQSTNVIDRWTTQQTLVTKTKVENTRLAPVPSWTCLYIWEYICNLQLYTTLKIANSGMYREMASFITWIKKAVMCLAYKPGVCQITNCSILLQDRSTTLNSISIKLGIFPQYTFMSSIQNNTHSDRPTNRIWKSACEIRRYYRAMWRIILKRYSSEVM